MYWSSRISDCATIFEHVSRRSLGGLVDVDAHDLGALRRRLEVVFDLEEVDGLLVGVPVAADALEYARCRS